MAEDVQPRLLPNLAYNRPFQHFTGGVDVTRPLAKLDKAFETSDTSLNLGSDPLAPDSNKSKMLIAGEYAKIENLAGQNPYELISATKNISNKWSTNLKDRSTELGAIQLSTAQRTSEVERIKKIDPKTVSDSQVQYNILKKDIEFELKGGTTQNEGGLGYSTYGEINTPPEIMDAMTEIDKVTKGFESDKRSATDIYKDDGTLIKGGTPGQWIVKIDGSKEFVKKEDVMKYAASAFRSNTGIQNYYKLEAEKNVFAKRTSQYQEQGASLEDAQKQSVIDIKNGDLDEYMQTELNKFSGEIATQMGNKYGFLKTEIDKDFKADNLFEGIGLEKFKNNSDFIMSSVEGGVVNTIKYDMDKIDEKINNNSTELKQIKDKAINGTYTLEQKDKIKELEKLIRIDKRVKNSAIQSYAVSNEGKEEIKKTYPKIIVTSPDKNGVHNIARFIDALTNPALGNISEEDYVDVISGKKILPEEILEKEFIYDKFVVGANPGGASGSNTKDKMTVKEAIDLAKSNLNKKVTTYSEKNPISSKNKFLNDAKLTTTGDNRSKGILNTANELLLKSVDGGNFMVNGTNDLNAYLENNVYNTQTRDKWIRTVRVAEEREDGQDVYQLILTPKDAANKEGVKSFEIRPKGNMGEIESKISQNMMLEAASKSGFEEDVMNNRDLRYKGVNTVDKKDGWVDANDEKKYLIGLWKKVDREYGTKFNEVLTSFKKDAVFTEKEKGMIGTTKYIPTDNKGMYVKATVVKQGTTRLISYDLVAKKEEDEVESYSFYGQGVRGKAIVSVKDLMTEIHFDRSKINNKIGKEVY